MVKCTVSNYKLIFLVWYIYEFLQVLGNQYFHKWTTVLSSV